MVHLRALKKTLVFAITDVAGTCHATSIWGYIAKGILYITLVFSAYYHDSHEE